MVLMVAGVGGAWVLEVRGEKGIDFAECGVVVD